MEENNDFDGIERNFEFWYRLQFSPIFKSTKSLVDIGDNNLYYALLPLIKKGDYTLAKNVLNWRAKTRPITKELKKLSSFLDIISELYIKFYNNELGSAEHLISKLDEYYGIIESYDMEYLKLSFLYCQSKDTDRLEDLEDKLNRLLIFYLDKMELLGLLADIKFDLGKFEDAMKLYNQVKDESKNGMLLLHINERLSMTY
ncbi:hypothetical protein HMPREF0378_1104 [Eubacterium nodatum ATCC 33099]|nr:hypothetical protein HMPREF0378_1104 [Eubacterium nodatum ATCC 33099]